MVIKDLIKRYRIHYKIHEDIPRYIAAITTLKNNKVILNLNLLNQFFNAVTNLSDFLIVRQIFLPLFTLNKFYT